MWVSGKLVQASSRGNDAVKKRRISAVVIVDSVVWIAERHCDTKLSTVFCIHFLCSGSVNGRANILPVFLSRQPIALFCVLNEGTIPLTSSLNGIGVGSQKRLACIGITSFEFITVHFSFPASACGGSGATMRHFSQNQTWLGLPSDKNKFCAFISSPLFPLIQPQRAGRVR
jgi:hypothetical protein